MSPRSSWAGAEPSLAVGEGSNEIAVTLDALAREGARRMIAAALKAEADDYVERFADERGEDGKRLVVRNGLARERRVTVGSGTVAVQAPRVNDKRIGERDDCPLTCHQRLPLSRAPDREQAIGSCTAQQVRRDRITCC